MHKHNLINSLLVSSAVALSSTLAACGRPDVVEMELGSLETLTVHVSAPPAAETRLVQVLLDPGITPGVCPRIHATATLNGVPVPLVEPGSVVPYMGFASMCVTPEFRIDDWTTASPDAEGTSTLEIRDASKTIVVAIRHLGVARTVSVVSPAEGAIGAGTHVTLAWSPSTDVLEPSSTQVRVGQSPSTQGIALLASAVTIAGASIEFDMPAGAQAGTIDVLSDTASIACCEGATRCFDDTISLVMTGFLLP